MGEHGRAAAARTPEPRPADPQRPVDDDREARDAVQVLAGAGEPQRDGRRDEPRAAAARRDARAPRPRREHGREQGEERRDRLEHHLARVLDAPGVDREEQPADRRHEREQPGRQRPDDGLERPRVGQVRLREVVRRAGGRRAVRDLGRRRERREHEPDGDLRERRVLRPVVLVEEDGRVALLEAGRDRAGRPAGSRPRRSRCPACRPRAGGRRARPATSTIAAPVTTRRVTVSRSIPGG